MNFVVQTRGGVLLVDDDEDVREAIRDVLELDGVACACAGNGLEALTYLSAHPAPALILLDWMMPTCDARGFRARQLEDPRLRSIPVVLLTADSHHDAEQARLNFDDILRKPIALEDLLASVRRYCPPPAEL